MASPLVTRCNVIIVGAGISGISAAKVLAKNGIDDFLILEASDRIGGRIRKENFAGVVVETGAGWVQGVGGKEPNPVWELATKSGLRTCYSDYSNARYNIYDQNGKIFPSGVAAESYNKAVNAAIQELEEWNNQTTSKPTSSEAKTPIELAIDFILHDFEMAEVEPIPTYTDFGEREFMVADERGYESLLYDMANEFLVTSDDGKIVDSRLQLNKAVQSLQMLRNGVLVRTNDDGLVYEANYIILTVSVGVLQSELISFQPSLPKWKTDAINKCDVTVYTKIFLKFPYKFWPCGPGTEFFIYAHHRRGYYTFWQHMENAYPGSNILVVTITNDESKRVEAQTDEETLKEAVVVLKDMFGPNNVPDPDRILVPRWWTNPYQRGSYSNYHVLSTHQDFVKIKAPVGRIYFSGEHTSERFNGYVHGGYLSGVDTTNVLLQDMRKEKELGYLDNQKEVMSNNLRKWDMARHLVHSGKLVMQHPIK